MLAAAVSANLMLDLLFVAGFSMGIAEVAVAQRVCHFASRPLAQGADDRSSWHQNLFLVLRLTENAVCLHFQPVQQFFALGVKIMFLYRDSS